LSLSLLVGLWWTLSGGEITAWLIGLPAVASAFWVSKRLGGVSESRISGIGLLYFIPYFLWESLRGGVDVALRTLQPRMRIQPGFIHYQSSLQSQQALTFFTYCISLLPGTLAADLQGDNLEIHVLNPASNPEIELSRLERTVARLFPGSGES
jgi:multicomponent Na+:H+ antiporter subunit E